MDTSVAMAWYLQESVSTSARVWQERMLEGEIEILVPPLHYLEFSNVLRTYVRRRELSSPLAREIYALHLNAPLEELAPPRSELLSTALDYDASSYDASYILLAKTIDAILLTAEKRSTPWVRKLGRHVKSLR